MFGRAHPRGCAYSDAAAPRDSYGCTCADVKTQSDPHGRTCTGAGAYGHVCACADGNTGTRPHAYVRAYVHSGTDPNDCRVHGW